MTIVVTTNGRTATRLVSKLPNPESDWIRLGNQNVTPYMVVDTPK